MLDIRMRVGHARARAGQPIDDQMDGFHVSICQPIARSPVVASRGPRLGLSDEMLAC